MLRGTRFVEVIVRGGRLALVSIGALALIVMAQLALGGAEALAQCAPANTTYCMSNPSGSGQDDFSTPPPASDNFIGSNILGDGAAGVVISGGSTSFLNQLVETVVNNVLTNYSVVAGAGDASVGTVKVHHNTLNINRTLSGQTVTVGVSAYGAVMGQDADPNALSVDTVFELYENTVTVKTTNPANAGLITVVNEIVGAGAKVAFDEDYTGLVQLKSNVVVIEATTSSDRVDVGASVYGAAWNGPIDTSDEKHKRNDLLANSVSVSGAGIITIGSGVVGATTSFGNKSFLHDNTVTINNTHTSTSIAGNAYGAIIEAGEGAELLRNKAILTQGNVTGSVIGAIGRNNGTYTVTKSTFQGNEATVTGGSAGGVVAARNIGSNTATDRNIFIENIATVNGGTITTGGVVAAENLGIVNSTTPNSYQGNKTNITGGTIIGNVYAVHDVSYASFQQASPNEVNIESSSAAININGSVYGNKLDKVGNANYARVTIAGKSTNAIAITGAVYGGYSGDDTAGDKVTQANNNTVQIEATTSAQINITGLVAGGYVEAGNSGTAANVNAQASNNQVLVKGLNGTNYIHGVIAGGYIYEGDTPAAGATYTASNNQVTLEDTYVGGVVAGGYIASTPGSGTFNATNNTLTLRGKVNITGTASLYGGYQTTAATTADLYTDNTLVFAQGASAPDKFTTISNFSHYQFHVNSDSSGPVLQTANLDLKDPNSATGNATIAVLDSDGAATPGIGDTVQLIASDTTPVTNGTYSATITGYHGTTIIYEYEVTSAASGLVATVKSMAVNPVSKSFSQVPIADIAFLNQGADLIDEYAVAAARTSLIGQQGFGVYGSLGYNKYRYSTGSHVDVKGLSGQIGVSAGTETGSGNLVAALFFEFGSGEYDSYSSIEGFGAFHGNGDLSYLGAGILARLDLGPEHTSRPYIEASARVGKSRFDFNSNDFQIGNASSRVYEFDGTYYGFHAGFGYIAEIDQLGTTFDLSVKYFFTEREAANFSLFGEPVHLDKTHSSRIKAGGRLTYALNDRVKPYVGGYYEYEADGESAVMVRNLTYRGASIKGSTGIGELGVKLESLSTPISLELGVKGSGGQRDGVGGTATLTYAF